MKHLLGIIVLVASVAAQEATFHLKYGLKLTAYDYTETAESTILNTEKSTLGDINGGYAELTVNLGNTRSTSYFQTGIYGSRTSGTTEYTGSYLYSGDGYGSVKSTTANTYDEIVWHVSRIIETDDAVYAITTGIGYYEWERSLSALQVETYQWYFAQLKLAVNKSLSNIWMAGFDVSGHYAFDPQMQTDIDGTSSVTFQLGETYTVRAGIPIQLSITDTLDLQLRVEYEYTRINRSDIVSVNNASYFEPSSEQKNWHLYSGIQFKF